MSLLQMFAFIVIVTLTVVGIITAKTYQLMRKIYKKGLSEAEAAVIFYDLGNNITRTVREAPIVGIFKALNVYIDFVDNYR